MAAAASSSTVERLKVIVEMCPEAIVTFDDRGTVIDWDGAGERLLGYARSDIIGRELATVLPSQRDAAFPNDRPIESIAHKADGTALPVEVTVTRVADDVNVAFLRDIRYRVELRAEAEKDRSDLAQVDKLKDEFLATISHELRTPLQSILGWADLLASSPDDLTTVKKAAAVITRNATAQAKVVGDMLDVSRVITGRLRLRRAPIDPRKIVERAVAAARPLFEAKRMTVEVAIERPIGEVSADAERVEQAIGNLLSNAAKFSAPGDSVRVSVRHEGEEIVITVTDRGEGISADFLPYVFDHFRQADARPTRRHGGLGLGLAIVRHIVELHGGKVAARSGGPGHGAEIEIRLQALSSAAVTLPPSEPPSTPAIDTPSLEGVRLLCVDDHADALELLDLALRRAGATVVTASSAAEAFDALESSSFDLVLTDIGMPGEDGLELLARWRACPIARRKPTPFAAITAFTGRSDRKKLLDAGFVDHLPKPMRAHEIIARVGRLVQARP